tara:strand:+ start:2370 stop:2885 length:516 start_codon:yes stop_codon:yes gene_type:complete
MNKILILIFIIVSLIYYRKKNIEQFNIKRHCNFNRERDELKADVRNSGLAKHDPLWECNNWYEHPKKMKDNWGTYYDYANERRDLIDREIGRIRIMKNDENVNKEINNKNNEINKNKSILDDEISKLQTKKNNINKQYEDLYSTKDQIELTIAENEKKNKLLTLFFNRVGL